MGQNTEEPVLGFGDQINFTELFRIKGRQGLYTLRSAVSKSGQVNMMEFLRPGNTPTVKAIHLECLGEFVFATLAGNDDLKINTVFNNLFDYEEANGVTDFDSMDMETLLPLMVPEYDPDMFKDYHAKKVLMWYKEITTKLKEIEDEENANENQG